MLVGARNASRAPTVRQLDSTSHSPARCVDTRTPEHFAKVQKSNNLQRDLQMRPEARGDEQRGRVNRAFDGSPWRGAASERPARKG